MHLCRKFLPVALLCAVLTYPFGQPGAKWEELSSPVSYPGRLRREGRALFIKGLNFPLLLLSFTHFLLSFPPSFTLFSITNVIHSLSPTCWPCCLFLPPFISSALGSLLQETAFYFYPPLCSHSLICCAAFVSRTDVFAIGDPNQPTILAVSVAGGIVLLIFLVTCFVVSGR